MNVLALDLSLTATGVAMPDGTTTTLRYPEKMSTPPTHDECRARIQWLRSQIRDLLPVDLVSIEGFSFGSKGSSVDQIYGLGWTVRLVFDDLAQLYVVISPASVKQYATGKGNAAKGNMRMALFKRFGLDIADDNQVDALWLRAMSLDAYGDPVVAVPAAHRKALEKIVWPPLAEVAA